MCACGGLSKQSVWDALWPHLTKDWKALEAVEHKSSHPHHSVKGKTDTVPSAKTNVPVHYWCQTGKCKGTRSQWAASHWPLGAGTCRASHRNIILNANNATDNNNFSMHMSIFYSYIPIDAFILNLCEFTFLSLCWNMFCFEDKSSEAFDRQYWFYSWHLDLFCYCTFPHIDTVAGNFPGGLPVLRCWNHQQSSHDKRGLNHTLQLSWIYFT